MIRLAIQSIHESNNQICGHEVLARKLTDGRAAAPGIFMAGSKARDWFELDMAVYRQVLEEPLLVNDPWPLFINMSPPTLEYAAHFAQALTQVEKIVRLRNAPTVIEVSEDSALPSVQLDLRLAALRRIGAQVAMDDFGVNYSNIERLAAHEWHYCKIDLYCLGEASNLDWLIDAKVHCDARNIRIVLERFESHDSRDLLQPFRKCMYQGYAFSRPRLISEMASPRHLFKVSG
ncbi:TPA: EAL domain-containing protein [Pseudomonas aeruginosa]|nr:EAL domain-containing protein [Pseudomonas aeruginosa]EIU2862482.1 EAL domain-containing protein [Pseudomonas aeruginosa]